ncbi:hypothetical protein Bca52824_062244 [Brassica carinata]|uniref:Replication factor A C-terminal domain-containing protein n=2 Tax=Brassica TaxID=3705 RepID=A0A8X7U739_BRACI|nr:hypothetical protein Bca52824_062244 [Brassica carinata]
MRTVRSKNQSCKNGYDQEGASACVLNPYQGSWTIKVRVTNKGVLRTYKNARGDGCVFNVELTDEEGTEIQATMMFNAADVKSYDTFQKGKVFYISRGSLKLANKQFKTVQKDYESIQRLKKLGAKKCLSLKQNSNVIGVVQSVSPTMSIRRKSDNEMIPKRDITLVDEVFHYPPSEAAKLKSWYDSEGIETYMAAIVSRMSPSANNGSRSMYSDRVCLSHFTTNPYLGEEKHVFFSARAYISFMKPDQATWYRACKTCNKKVTETVDTGYWCEGCQNKDEECCLRYIIEVKVSDSTGEAWFSAFNVEAEKMIGCTNDELNMLKSEEGEANEFQTKLKEATWSSHLFRVSVSQQEYNSEKRQRITVRRVSPIDFRAKTRLLLQDVSKNKKTSQ